MENKTCQKCGRDLPDNYKYKKCESCRTLKANKIKKNFKRAGAIITAVGVVLLNKDKIPPKK